jgi:stearoyl-CoA desaturase (delta-9 desaturase)
MTKHQLSWLHVGLLATGHVLAVLAVLYLVFHRFSWWSVGLALLWFACCGVSITGGYHRLFAHPTYRAAWPVRLFYLLFGAASVQNSALKWAADHREHHARTDEEEDPYNIRRGFWWAHIGWVFHKDVRAAEFKRSEYRLVPDLLADPLVMWQHRHYVLVTVALCVVVPFCLGLLWGDPWGALLLAGFLRLVLQWHATFAVNSFAHLIGTQPYTTRDSARDSWLVALFTCGEGYHNFHHRFQCDYRNGVRYYHFDPTKWFVWTLSKLGLAWDLRRTPPDAIDRARAAVETERAARARGPGPAPPP